MTPSDALVRLEELAEHRHRDPVASLKGVRGVLADTDDPLVEAAAFTAIGLIQYQLGQLDDAVASFRRSIAVGQAHCSADHEARARASLAPTLIAQGDAAAAEREIAGAWARASPANRGYVAFRQGVVLTRMGRLNEAMAVFARARRWLEEVDDQASLMLAHMNRAVCCSYQGNHRAALESGAAAEQIARDRDFPIPLAMIAHNMAFDLVRLGRLPDALAAFDRVTDAYAAIGNPNRNVAALDGDRCEALLLTGLVPEAQDAATRAVDALVAEGDMAHLMECRVLLARAFLAGGDYPGAATEAALAAAGFDSASRPAWAALARYVGIQAEILEQEEQASVPRGLLSRSRQIAAELDLHGWAVESVHVRTFAGRLALAFGHPEVARQELTKAVTARSIGTADLRAQAWHAAALLRLADGNRGGAKRALSAGMAVVDDYRASLGATELRAHATSHGTDLARLGMRLALEDRRALEVFRWAERWRAGALQRPSLRPPDDERLAEHLTELRGTHSQLREAAMQAAAGEAGEAEGRSAGAGGRPAGEAGEAGEAGAGARLAGGAGARAAGEAMRARIVELERLVRTETLLASGDTVQTGRVDVAAIRVALGRRWLVEYVSLDGQLYAVTVNRDRVRLHQLGPVPVEQEKRYLLFAIRRVLLAPTRPGAAEALAATAARVDEMLIAPLGLPPDTPLIVVPTGILHSLPWQALPSLARRSTTVAPSAALWLGATTRLPSSIGQPRPGAPEEVRGVALVAGPQLPGADEEVRLVAQVYPNVRTLTGATAVASAVMSALEEAEVAHLAAHGRFRSDSPLFSSLLLADGPITVYDLERLRRAPRTVVLATCDAAVSAVRLGDELLGTAAALIGLGVHSVIAPVMPVPDGTTAPFMVALHRCLQSGQAPAAALAAARGGEDEAVGAAFICIGSDDARPYA